jgi:hypothetical protein
LKNAASGYVDLLLEAFQCEKGGAVTNEGYLQLIGQFALGCGHADYGMRPLAGCPEFFLSKVNCQQRHRL